jgi:hypothetical protein
MVAAAGTIAAPRVLDRWRIVTADPRMPGSRQPYHSAAELPFPRAEEFLRKAIASSRALRNRGCVDGVTERYEFPISTPVANTSTPPKPT